MNPVPVEVEKNTKAATELKKINMEILLSTAYFPSIEYMACLVKASHVFIEKHETYPKQSLRNRCYLASSQGIQSLSVPVVKPMGNHTPVNKILMDEKQNFRNHHYKTIQTLYNSAPFFEYYEDFIKECVFYPENNLFEYNLNMLKLLMKILKIQTQMTLTESFNKDSDDKLDLRFLISKKKTCGSSSIMKSNNRYFQVFEQKNGFIENLSVIDLIFNEGPASISILENIKLNLNFD